MRPFASLFFPLFLDRLKHGLRIGGLLEGLTKFGLVKHLGDVGKGMEVLLKLALGNEEKHDKVDGLIVQGIEIHSFWRPAQRS